MNACAFHIRGGEYAEKEVSVKKREMHSSPCEARTHPGSCELPDL